MPKAQTLLFAGDPHGNFSPILRACAAEEPGSLIVVGDLGLAAPLRQVLAPAFARGWDVRWIIGNHDADTEPFFDHLVVDHPEGDLGGRVIALGGLRVAGLGGVFKPRVWSPATRSAPAETEPPRFRTRSEFLQSLDARERWRGGLPLWHRDTIFPEDFVSLAAQRFDLLVTHEAPSSHPHGIPAIDELARSGSARLIVHGHHHRSYEGSLPCGIRVRGLGVAETWICPDR